VVRSFGSVFFASACTLVAVITLVGQVEPPRPPVTRKHALEELSEGASLVLMHPILRPLLFVSVVYNLSWFFLMAALVPSLRTGLHETATLIGITLGAYGVGLMLGAAIAARVLRRLPLHVVLSLGPVSAEVAALLMLSTLPYHSFILAGASLFVFGVGPMIWAVSTATLRQQITPLPILARTIAVVTFATFGARPLGAALGAAIGGAFGARGCLITVAIGFMLQATIFFAARLSPHLEVFKDGALDLKRR